MILIGLFINSLIFPLALAVLKGDCAGDLIHAGGDNTYIYTCDDPFQRKPVPAGTCVCPTDKPFLTDGDVCGTWDEQCRGTKAGCPGDQIWDIGPSCDPSCGNPHPACPRNLAMRCQCPRDKPMLIDNSKCVAREDCAYHCPGELIWRTGVPMWGTGHCSYPDDTECAGDSCEDRCACPPDSPIQMPGYSCMSRELCDPPAPDYCTGDLEWNPMGDRCEQTCEDHTGCSKPGYPTCQCPWNTPFRYGSDQCMTLDQCAEKANCPGDLIWKMRRSACPASCDDPYPDCGAYYAGGSCDCPDASPIMMENDKCISLDECE